MSDLDTLVKAVNVVLQWQNIVLIFGISIVGLIIGFLPGIGALAALPLIVPITFGMSPAPALIILAVIYMSAVYGGSISAILLNTPGTPASAATCLDGYPMAQQGKGGVAIGLSMMSSFIGGFIGIAGLIFLSPLISHFALKFQPAEYFMLSVLGLALISASVKGSLLKSLVSAAFGVIVSSVGMDIMTGQPRFAFGSLYFTGGIPFIPLIIGLFAFSEMFVLIQQQEETIAKKGELSGKITEGLKEVWKHPKTLIRSSLIGLAIGALPGEGAAVANFTAYLVEARGARNPEAFGTGIPAGIIAPETSNNACVAGTLIPTLTLGIPGSGVAAVFLGGVMIHGLNPGLELFTRHREILYTLFFGLVVANFVIFICGVALAKYFARVTTVPHYILVPTIIAIGVCASYVGRNQVLDVVVAASAGVVAYLMRKYGYSPISFLVAYILAPIAENSFFQALLIADDSYWTFVVRPISGCLLFLTIMVIFAPPILRHIRSKGNAA